MKSKICVITTTRAESGLLNNFIQRLCDDDFFDSALFLKCGKFQYGVNSLLLCAFNKAAGIYYHDLCLCFIGSDLKSPIVKDSEHNLRVDKVFRASEGDKSNLCFVHFKKFRFFLYLLFAECFTYIRDPDAPAQR